MKKLFSLLAVVLFAGSMICTTQPRSSKERLIMATTLAAMTKQVLIPRMV